MLKLKTKVRLFPDDEYEVIGIIREILPQGIVFEIEKSQKPSRYREGKNVFIAYSSNLIFIEV